MQKKVVNFRNLVGLKKVFTLVFTFKCFTIGSTLKEIKNKFPEKRIAAGNGSNAHQRCIVGLKGRDVTIQAPLGIVLYDQVGNKVGRSCLLFDFFLFLLL